jgi:hypothetical protein
VLPDALRLDLKTLCQKNHHRTSFDPLLDGISVDTFGQATKIAMILPIAPK